MRHHNFFKLAILPLVAMSACSTRYTSLNVLNEAAKEGQCLYAMQDALSYGRDWHVSKDSITTDGIERCDIKSVCGDYPAIVGFDLGEIELDSDSNLDKVSFEFMRRAALAQAQRGGLVTFSWHSRNPLTGGDAWDVSSNKVVESILEGGEQNEKFMLWLSRVANFLNSLRDKDGNLIPIIFRPWHENTGSWFWWGQDLCSDEQYVQLWQMTFDYLVNKKGLTGMYWAYSPSSINLKENAMRRYPGDEILDIIGVDRYDQAGRTEVNPDYISGLQSDLEFLDGVAKEHNLLLAVTETGLEGQSYSDWWTESLLKGIGDYPVCYVLTWRNAWDKDGHYFSPYPGAKTETNFDLFYKSDKTCFLNEL